MAGPRRVFLSHTSEVKRFPVLRSFVAAAEAAVSAVGDAVIDMTYFGARDDKPAEYCQARVQSCDVYVGLIGLRYGSPVRDRPEMSYVELEFEAATRARLPRLVFLLDEEAALPIPPVHMMDTDPQLYVRQQAFRARLLDTGIMTVKVATPEQMELKLVQALQSVPQPLPEALDDRVAVGEIPRQPPGFQPRAGLLANLEAAESGVLVVQAVTGMRGVGKTQLAAAYARARVDEGRGLVGWVSAETRDGMLSDLARIAARLGVPDPGGDSLESARRLRDHLTTRPGPGLLVFDNATDPDMLRPFLPATGSTRVVITSTDRAFAELGKTVDVTLFSREESVSYLHSRTRLDDEAGADALAAALGDWPLGLAQAAAAIVGNPGLTYPQYLEMLRNTPMSQLLGRIRGSDYPQPAAAALRMSIQISEDRDQSGLTNRVLRVLARLSPDGVRRDLLGGITGGHASRPEVVDAALENCVTGSLLTWSVTGEALVMHRLVGRVLRERDLAAGQEPATMAMVLELLEPQLFDNSQAWARRGEGAHLVTQIEAAWETGRGSSGEAVLRLLRNRVWAVRQLRTAADLSRAIELAKDVLASCDRILGSEHPETFGARNILADTQLAAGRAGDAQDLSGQTLDDSERTLGKNHPATMTSRHILGHASQAVDHYDRSGIRELFEDNLADREQILGPDHPDTMISRESLALSYTYAGWHREAINLLMQNLADRERVLGPDHPDTIKSRHTLGFALVQAGVDGNYARELLTQALADRQRVLGPEHPDTIESRMYLAYSYREAEDYDKAIGLLQTAVADCERALSPDHPHALYSRHNLAHVYSFAGRPGDAVSEFERSLADYARVWGPNHHHTHQVRDGLARARLALQLQDTKHDSSSPRLPLSTPAKPLAKPRARTYLFPWRRNLLPSASIRHARDASDRLNQPPPQSLTSYSSVHESTNQLYTLTGIGRPGGVGGDHHTLDQPVMCASGNSCCSHSVAVSTPTGPTVLLLCGPAFSAGGGGVLF